MAAAEGVHRQAAAAAAAAAEAEPTAGDQMVPSSHTITRPLQGRGGEEEGEWWWW